ncbi:thioredoxin family protein [Riemerella anatipestifer]|uniref:thioredoxin family protein n=1 Tax=Riemerella anatipestifer TaxID=34085 RepID=UPI0007ED9C8B|nr:thioredoxin family protein [Riemerella anatipestifer]MBT0525532.1 thioredoxin family protein [Riemerella anatipestifer]MBT0527375.1 thioredoxin family protein [Riemerella anatipestifer]MBT0529416.1 thioredoxin family protein [Riemerella anatipestifer]MBT0531217.1 thioredoxin family protein [Riemerella anatipestifer]MBT0533248.1 thioredoxin family protein [Riemerella anatipestifer]
MKYRYLTLGLMSATLTILSCNKNAENPASNTNDSTEIKQKLAEQEKDKLEKPYHPEDNAEEKIATLISQAQKENKNIILQAGGNWCIWCLRFNDYINKTPEIKEIIDQNYLYYHLNYSKENENKALFEKYGNPGEKYGYPVFIVLDQTGKVIHIQNSAVLEENKGYSLDKVKAFFNEWKPKNL